MFIQMKSSNKYKSILLVLTGSMLSIYEATLQKIWKMSHFEHRIVRCKVGSWGLIIHMGVQWNRKLPYISLTRTMWTKRLTDVQGKLYYNTQMYRLLYSAPDEDHMCMGNASIDWWELPRNSSCALLSNRLISWVYREWWGDFSVDHNNQMEQR